VAAKKKKKSSTQYGGTPRMGMSGKMPHPGMSKKMTRGMSPSMRKK
jgi:hypothetical protein